MNCLLLRFKRISRNPAFSAIGSMSGAVGLGQLAILATLPFLTRLYGPAAFGLYALVMSFIGVASVGVCLSLELAIVQAEDVMSADDLFLAAIYSTICTSALSACVLAIFIGAGFFGYGYLPWWSAPVVGFIVGLNGLYIASRYRLLRDQSYTTLASATLLQSAARALAPLLWFICFPSWAGLAFGELTGRLVGVFRLLKSLVPKLRLTIRPEKIKFWWDIVCRERRYTTVLLPAVLMDSLASLLIAPLLAGAFGASAAGMYFMTASILVAPSALLGTAAADFIHTRSAQILNDMPKNLMRFFQKSAFLLLLSGSVIYLSVYFLGLSVFPIFFGKKWAQIGVIAQTMTPFMIVAFVASPCSRLLLVLKRTDLKVISDVVRLIGTPILIVTASSFQLTFETTMWTLSWFLAAAYASYFILTFVAVRQAGTQIKSC